MAELRIVLVGKTGVGKSACGNTILGGRVFESKLSASSVTPECQKATGAVAGQTVAVVDTPGLFDTSKDHDKVKNEIARSVSFAAPGPHVFLIVIQPTRFTEEEKETVKILQKLFGKETKKYSMILFTRGDDLEAEDTDIEKIICKDQYLCGFVSQCDGGYHVFNNRDKKNHDQVTELRKKINMLVKRNGGSCYTNEMFQEAERAIREEQKRLLGRNPAMDRKEARRRAEGRNAFLVGVAAAVAGGAVAGPIGVAVGAIVGVVSSICSIQ